MNAENQKRLYKIGEWGLSYTFSPHVGYVYLLKPVGHNVYKIGCTTDLERRMKTFQRERSYPLEYVASIFVDDCEGLESGFHKKYAQYYLIGEWFVLPQTVVDDFIKWGAA